MKSNAFVTHAFASNVPKNHISLEYKEKYFTFIEFFLENSFIFTSKDLAPAHK